MNQPKKAKAETPPLSPTHPIISPEMRDRLLGKITREHAQRKSDAIRGLAERILIAMIGANYLRNVGECAKVALTAARAIIDNTEVGPL